MARSVTFISNDMMTKMSVLTVSMIFTGLIFMQAYQLWKASQDPQLPATTQPSREQTQIKRGADIRQLAASHLFGDVQVVTQQFTEVREDKSLNLTLRGIIANRGGSTSLAIIQSSPNSEETFAVGENVFNKGTLNHVADDHVILKRSNGQLARLQLPEQNVDSIINEEFLPLAQPDYHEETPMESSPAAEQAMQPEITAEQPEADVSESPDGTAPLPDEPQELPLEMEPVR
jgi:type II secretory pathway component PulC